MAELPPNDDLLIRYLDGELPDAERTALEARLHSDEKLNEELMRLKVAIQAVNQLGTRENVTLLHTEMMQSLKAEQSGRVVPLRKNVRYFMAVAAAVAALFVGFRLYQATQLSPENLYNEAFVDFTVSASRSSGPGFSSLEEQYRQKNYNAVIGSVRSARLSAKDSLLVGLACLQTGRTTQAIAFFQPLALSSNEVQPDAEFYLALSRIKNKEYSRALPLLQKIADDPLHLYNERISTELVEKIKKLNAQ